MLGNLPIHPMLVHFAVVLLIATAVLQLAAVFLPRVRAWLGWTMPALGVLTAIVTRVAQSFGEILEERMAKDPLIHDHAEWGDKAGAVAIALGLFTVLYWLATTPRPLSPRVGFLRGRPVAIGIAVVTVVLCVAAIILDVLAGHSGAVAVWTPR